MAGYQYYFEPYAGVNVKRRQSLGLGESVVLSLLAKVEHPGNHIITFDNFFTAHSLIARLGYLGFFVTGTVRDNRMGFEAEEKALSVVKSPKKKVFMQQMH